MSIVDDDEAPVVPELPEVVVVTATLRVSELSVSEGDTDSEHRGLRPLRM